MPHRLARDAFPDKLLPPLESTPRKGGRDHESGLALGRRFKWSWLIWSLRCWLKWRWGFHRTWLGALRGGGKRVWGKRRRAFRQPDVPPRSNFFTQRPRPLRAPA